MWERVYVHGTHMESRRQPVATGSLIPSCGSGNGTQVNKLGSKPSTTEPSHQSLAFKGPETQ